MSYTEAAAAFSLLSDPHRLHILCRLAREGAWRSAGELLEDLPISQPTLSHHMKLLCEGGLVERRRQGQRTLYRLDRPAMTALLAIPLAEDSPAPAAEESKAEKPHAPVPERPAVIVRSGHKW